MAEPNKINLAGALARFSDHWSPKIVGEFIIVPKGVEHMPVAPEECEVLLLEPKTTLNTGSIVNERAVAELERL